jgi:hypothetical protein
MTHQCSRPPDHGETQLLRSGLWQAIKHGGRHLGLLGIEEFREICGVHDVHHFFGEFFRNKSVRKPEKPAVAKVM